MSPTGWGPSAPFPGVLVPSACPPPGSPVSLPPTLVRAGLRLRPGLSCSLCPGLFPGTCFPQVGVFRPCRPTVCHSCLGTVWHPGRGQGLLVASSAQLWGPFSRGDGDPTRQGLGRGWEAGLSPLGGAPTGIGQEALGDFGGGRCAPWVQGPGLPGGPKGEEEDASGGPVCPHWHWTALGLALPPPARLRPGCMKKPPERTCLHPPQPASTVGEGQARIRA